jgi:hypothetical protein
MRQRSVQGGVYLLYLHSFAFKYSCILYMLQMCTVMTLIAFTLCMQAASFKDRWQRSHAEMQNLIARQAREKETMQTYAVQVRWLRRSRGSGLELHASSTYQRLYVQCMASTSAAV